MELFKEISAEEIQGSPFKMIGKDWMLVAAEKEGKVNAMTASWGGLGVMWNKNVAYVFLRPQRYTKEFVDSSEKFSLSFYDESYREKLQYLGSVSGRQEDKMAKAGLTLLEGEDAPCFEEARVVLICRKMYAQKFEPECFVDKSVEKLNYPNKDYHTMYIAEIEKILVSE
jgi:flavin reductase (DIM6/NTAB) family NADH-FMN oxidoreductase RutF